jgi:hypothetical protein
MIGDNFTPRVRHLKRDGTASHALARSLSAAFTIVK